LYKLFYFPRNASWAPHLVLEEMSVEYELTLVDRISNAHKSEAYMALNPTGRIPTLVDGNFIIFESAAICLHLCDQNPQANLIPKVGDPSRAQFYQWLFYLTATVQPELMVYFYPSKHTTNEEATDSIVQAQENRITEMFTLLDKQLEDREYLIGNNYSVCDCFLFMLAHWASDFKQPPLSFSNLGRYLRNIAKRQAVQHVCTVEGTSLNAYE